MRCLSTEPSYFEVLLGMRESWYSWNLGREIRKDVRDYSNEVFRSESGSFLTVLAVYTESMKGRKLRLISVNPLIFFLSGDTLISSLVVGPERLRLMIETSLNKCQNLSS